MKIIAFLSFLFLLCLKSNAQISNVARLQPHPLKSESMKLCCNLLEIEGHEEVDPLHLLQCVNESISVQSSFEESKISSHDGQKKTVALLTYMSPETDVTRHFAVPDILEYGAYHAANTAMYAEHNNMLYRIATEDVGGNNEPADVRWNKVRLLIDALDPTSGWAKNMKYIVWLDADAIVLDIGFSVEAVGEQFPHAHFIASADIRQGYINSGFLVIKNSPWARKFLKDWWEISDRSEVCDQDAFDAVYTQYTVLEREARRSSSEAQRHLDDGNGRVEEKIRILRRDALNSDPPATLRQQEYNQILHLMGESSLMRKSVFKEAFQKTCKTLLANDESHEYLPAQLGQSQQRLYESALSLYRYETAERFGNLTARIDLVTFPPDGHKLESAIKEAPSDLKDFATVDKELYDQIETSLMAIDSCPHMFEGLGRSAHHLCDLLVSSSMHQYVQHTPIDSANKKCRSPGRREMLDIRKDLFDLAIRWLDVTSIFLNGINGLIHRGIHENEEHHQDDIKVRMRSLLDKGVMAFLHLLKRGAEAGNDLFGAISNDCYFPSKSIVGNKDPASNGQKFHEGGDEEQEEKEDKGVVLWARQKLVVSEKVFALLRELDARVSDESKHVPRHMRALMHQNVAYLHYTVAEYFRAPPGSDIDANTAPSHDKDSQLRNYHLYQAEQHALSSVHVFDTTFGDTSPDPNFSQNHHSKNNRDGERSSSMNMQADRSTNEEHALSLQILAAIYCTDSRNVSLGLEMWERTIAKARDNLQGVSLGKPMERLADIYHNAAVCHFHAAQSATSNNNMVGYREKLFSRASTLANKAVNARKQIQSATAIPSVINAAIPAHKPSSYVASPAVGDDLSDGDAAVDFNDFGDTGTLQLSIDLLNSIKRKQEAFETTSFSSSTTPTDQANSQEDTDMTALRYLSELDEDEWEECEVGEEGCEAFIVDTDTDTDSGTIAVGAPNDKDRVDSDSMNVGLSLGSKAERENHSNDLSIHGVEEDKMDEEDEDIEATRRRYAAQVSFLSPP